MVERNLNDLEVHDRQGPDVTSETKKKASLWRRVSTRLRREALRTGLAGWEWAAYGVLVATALGMRLWDLGSRAMHHDESLHALYARNLSVGTGYAHDPMMHGPFQMEATAGIFFVLGDSDFTARLLYVLAGTVLVALPILLRGRLGRPGAVMVSAMLAFSPAMLYFSRFARNDILMALWTLGLVICLWRYLDEGKNRYLYAGAALLALTFATKESAYIVTFTLGSYLLAVLAVRSWPAISHGITAAGVSPPTAVRRLAAGAWAAAMRGLRETRPSRQGAFFALLFTLSLPMGAALVSILQNTALLSWSNLVLAQPIGNADIGAPKGGALVVAAVVVGLLLWVSVVLGVRWLGSVWWRCAAIYYSVWVLLFTTFFTNLIPGIGSGIWQSLGYWLVQQGVARGSQPGYYYLMITPLYEFLPLVFAVLGGIYYLRRRDPFGHFLVFWALSTFVIYTYVSEKMPWLLVSIALPLILLAGKFLGEVVERIEWRRVLSHGGVMVLPGVPLFLVLSWRLALVSLEEADLVDYVVLVALLGALVAMPLLAVYLGRRIGGRNLAYFGLVPLAVVLLALTLLTGLRAAYRNGDVPVEMIVYTQTSPDLARLYKQVVEAGGQDTPILIDQSSGFSWPWAWYLRDHSRVSYAGPAIGSPDQSVLVLHVDNSGNSGDPALDGYTEGIRIAHRRWFPETYKGSTLGDLASAIFDRRAWRKTMDYFLHRDLDTPLGSEDVYVYFSSEFPVPFAPSQ